MPWCAPGPEPKGNFMVETDMSEQALQSYPPQAIAIVGLAGRFPDARSLDDFWRNLRTGVESLETFGDAELDAALVPAGLRNDKQFVRKGTTLDGAELFDARFFGISPREADQMDLQHRLALELAWEALEDAGQAADRLAKLREPGKHVVVQRELVIEPRAVLVLTNDCFGAVQAIEAGISGVRW